MTPLLVLPLAAALAVAPAPVKVTAGPLTLTFHRPVATQRFHIIDQLSAWSDSSHQQYQRALDADPRTAITAAERTLLDEHKKLRQRLGYGVLERIYYRDSGWEAELDRAVAEGKVHADEAAAERQLLALLGPRVDGFIKAGEPELVAFLAQVKKHQPEISAFAARASRFTLGTRVDLEAYLIASTPTSYGGGYNGGVLTVELGAQAHPLGLLIHESWHAFVAAHQESLEAAVAANPGLDFETLSEGMAHAIFPGIFQLDSPVPTSDRLAEQVSADLARHKTWSDAYTRDDRLGLALRPLLAAALDDPAQTLATFVPRAVDVWRGTRSLSAGLDGKPRRRCLLLGPGRAMKTFFPRVAAQGGYSVWGRGLQQRFLDEMLGDWHQGTDQLVLLLTAADLARLPPAFGRLTARVAGQLKDAAAARRTLELQTAVDGMGVLFLLAPDETALDELAKSTPAVDRLFPRAAGDSTPTKAPATP